jgi:spore germination cell wall hydrolase CwlJ-like protein
MKIISNALTLFILVAVLIMCWHGRPKEQVNPDLSERELSCAVAAIYHEGRGESLLGQAAIMHVIMNRVRSSHYPDTICGVVWQPDQFSFTNDGHSDRMMDLPAIEKAVDIALAVSRGKISDPTGGALHYYAQDKVKPRWARHGWRLILGDHTFVKLAGR